MAKTIARDQIHKGYIDLDKNELRNVRAQNAGADIASPVNGLWFYRSDTHKFRGYVNGAWDDFAMMSDVTSAGISSTIVDAKGDLIVGTAADTVARKAAGVDGTALFADSVEADGLKWRGIVAADLSDFQTAARAAISVGDTATLDLSYAAGVITGAVLDSPTVAGATPAQLRDRSTHTGSQLFSTINTSNTDRLLGRDTAAGGAVEEIAVSGGIEFTGAAGIRTSAFTGDVTKAAGGTVLSISNNAATNAHLADMAQSTIKGRAAGAGTGDPTDLSVAQVKTLLAYAAGDVAFTPAQGIAATTVQGAIEEAVTDLTAAITAATEAKAWKDPVEAASVGANITLSGTQTIDGVALVAGDRVLIKDQTNHAQDGIYVVAAGAWSRAADADTAAEHTNATVLVLAGTQNAGDTYTQTATIATLGTTNQAWVKSGEGNTVYTADGTTIELVGSSFRIAAGAAGAGLTGGGGSALAVGAGTGITVNANDVAIAAGGVGVTQLATAVAGNGLTGGGGAALAVGAGTGISVAADTVGIANGGVTETQLAASVAGNGLTGGAGTALAVNVGAGLEINTDAVRIAASAAGNGLTGGAGSALAVGAGTGITVAADSVSIDTSVVVRKYATNIGNASLTSFTVTHNLNTLDVQVTVFKNSDGAEWEVEVVHATVNTVTIIFTGYTPALNEFRAVVMG